MQKNKSFKTIFEMHINIDYRDTQQGICFRGTMKGHGYFNGSKKLYFRNVKTKNSSQFIVW